MISKYRTPEWFARLATNAGEQISVAEWWRTFEPVDLLECPRATFGKDAGRLAAICRARGVAYAEGARGQPPLFPLWLLSEFYPADGG